MAALPRKETMARSTAGGSAWLRPPAPAAALPPSLEALASHRPAARVAVTPAGKAGRCQDPADGRHPSLISARLPLEIAGAARRIAPRLLARRTRPVRGILGG